MRTTINVEHLSGYLPRLSQIKNRIDNVLNIYDMPNRRQRFEEILGVILMHWSIYYSRSDRVDPDAIFRILHCETSRYGFEAALCDHGD